MTKPLRRALLNREIAHEARRIAHACTHTCRGEALPLDPSYHTARCNSLFEEIIALATQVKLAREQPPLKREPPPPFELEGAPADV